MLDPTTVGKLAKLKQQLEQDMMPPSWIFTASRWRKFDQKLKPRTNLVLSRRIAGRMPHDD